MRSDNNSLGFTGWLGLIILAGFFFFKWLPEWTWCSKAPEIYINDHIFESHPVWSGETATITSEFASDIHIRIRPEEAVDQRAKLTVTVDGQEVKDDCSYTGSYFCYKIDKSKVTSGDSHEIIAKNDAGEKHATLKVVIKPKDSSSSDTKNTKDADNSTDSTNQSPSTPSITYPGIKSTSCLHYEAGRCWDEIEDDVYSSGLYDHNYGYYGGSYIEPDNCDSRCQDILQDAYDEGYYDSF